MLKELTESDKGSVVLWQNKNNKEYCIYSHTDTHGVYMYRAGNNQPICMGLETPNEFYKVEFK